MAKITMNQTASPYRRTQLPIQSVSREVLVAMSDGHDTAGATGGQTPKVLLPTGPPRTVLVVACGHRRLRDF
jgi:hypothetical protein